jgi:hypothetical protein
VLKTEAFRPTVEAFNAADQELYVQEIPNARAWEFLAANVPLLDCPDATIQEVYYFRWWTFRKHVRRTEQGRVLTEFLAPVRHAGPGNTVSCALGHHLAEGRWLADRRVLDETVHFWLRGHGGKPQPHLHKYSSWLAHALLGRLCVDGREQAALELLDDLVADYRQWEAERLGDDGLFWQYDVQDAMEESISGSRTARNARPTINGYMYGNAAALALLAERAGRQDLAAEFAAKARRLKELVQAHLWDEQARFFKVRLEGDGLADVRELLGYTPWFVRLPDGGYEDAWRQLFDEQGFAAPFGPTTAERRHRRFAIAYDGDDCQWNGPSWPFSTSVTLTGLANVLNDYRQDVVRPGEYFSLLSTYAASHRLTRDDGTVVRWIDENLHPFTGVWLARERKKAKAGFCERGKDYNHSTFCDLVITGLVGLRPRADETVEVNPLAPPEWDYFCLDGVGYHGRALTVLWDRTGRRYGRGAGLAMLADGRELAHCGDLGHLTTSLPSV